MEEGSTDPLRAQIRVTDDISNGIERTITLTRSGPVGELVDAWIERMVDGAAADEAL
jgi:hypothetical protein